MKTKKELKLQAQREKEANFVSHWPTSSKLPAYNSLEDRHAEYYFELPSVQKHFRSLQRRTSNRQKSYAASDLVQRIEKSRFILNERRSLEICESQGKQQRKPRQNLRYSRQINVYSTLNHKTKQQSDSYTQNVNKAQNSFSFSQIIQRYSTSRRLPSLEPTGVSSSEVKAEHECPGRNSHMRGIIGRRKAKNPKM